MNKERQRQNERIQSKEVKRKELYKERRKSYIERQILADRRSGKWKVMKEQKR